MSARLPATLVYGLQPAGAVRPGVVGPGRFGRYQGLERPGSDAADVRGAERTPVWQRPLRLRPGRTDPFF